MKKPTLKQMKERPSLWAKEVKHLGIDLRICHPDGLVETCLSWDNKWMISGWSNLLVKNNCEFIGWL